VDSSFLISDSNGLRLAAGTIFNSKIGFSRENMERIIGMFLGNICSWFLEHLAAIVFPLFEIFLISRIFWRI